MPCGIENDTDQASARPDQEAFAGASDSPAVLARLRLAFSPTCGGDLPGQHFSRRAYSRGISLISVHQPIGRRRQGREAGSGEPGQAQKAAALGDAVGRQGAYWMLPSGSPCELLMPWTMVHGSAGWTH